MLLRLVPRGNPTVVFSSLLPLCPALSSPTEVVGVMTVEAVRAVREAKVSRGWSLGFVLFVCFSAFLRVVPDLSTAAYRLW